MLNNNDDITNSKMRKYEFGVCGSKWVDNVE